MGALGGSAVTYWLARTDPSSPRFDFKYPDDPEFKALFPGEGGVNDYHNFRNVEQSNTSQTMMVIMSTSLILALVGYILYLVAWPSTDEAALPGDFKERSTLREKTLSVQRSSKQRSKQRSRSTQGPGDDQEENDGDGRTSNKKKKHKHKSGHRSKSSHRHKHHRSPGGTETMSATGQQESDGL